MARLTTARNAEINKNIIVKIANRALDTPSTTDYGEVIYKYGEITCLNLCLMPFTTEVEAKAYGVSLLGGRKATLTIEESKLFNEFTHIWVSNDPDTDRQSSEYKVKDIRVSLNNAVLVVEARDGANE